MENYGDFLTLKLFPPKNFYIWDSDLSATFRSDSDTHKVGNLHYLTVSNEDSREGDEMINIVSDY